MEQKKKSRSRLTAILAITALLLAVLTAALTIYCIPYFKPESVPVVTSPPTLAPTEPPTEPEPTLPPPDPNPYGPLDFQYDENNYLKLIEGESITGIDVSRYQNEIDFEAVKASGVDFVIIRLGYRGYGSGRIVYDDYALTNLYRAAEAGLDIGVYFFSQAITLEEAEEEAYFVLNAIEEYEITMPIVYDWEPTDAEDSRTKDMDRETLTKCCKVFAETIESAGYWPMIYFNRRQAKYHMDISALKEYDFWLAAYTDRMEFPYKIKMWQYTNTGRVPGIDGDVDINVFFPEA